MCHTTVCGYIRLYSLFVSVCKKVVSELLICRACQCQSPVIFYLWPRSKERMWSFLVETFICKLSSIWSERANTYQRRTFLKSYGRNVFIENLWVMALLLIIILNKSNTHKTFQNKDFPGFYSLWKYQNKFLYSNLFVMFYIIRCNQMIFEVKQQLWKVWLSRKYIQYCQFTEKKNALRSASGVSQLTL